MSLTTTPQTGRPQLSARSLVGQLTVGAVLLLLVGCAAAIMRFSALGTLPLSLVEAGRALTVWQFWQPGDTPAAFAVSPAYFSLTSILIALFGDSDVVVRLVPALFGLATVFLPWLWRSRLGIAGALTAALLLATSPLASIVSVSAGGDSIALFALLLLFISWLRFRQSEHHNWLLVAAIAVGTGLASSPVFYSGLVTLTIAWLLQGRLTPLDEGRSPDGRSLERRHLLRALLVMLVSFTALATLFLWRPAGFGAAATQLTSWIGQFSLPTSIAQIIEPFLALGRYEPVIIVVGSIAILWATWRGEALSLFLATWFGAALLLMLLQSGVMENTLVLILPAYLLIAMLISRQFQTSPSLIAAGLYVVLILLGIVTYFNAGRYLRVVTFSGGGLSFLYLTLIALLFAVVLVSYVRSWDKLAATQATLAALLTFFLIFGWGTGWWMTHRAANEPRERWITVGTDDDVVRLSEMLHELSWQVDGSASGISIFSALDNAVLRWYLRDFSNTTFGASVPPGAEQTAIITNETAEPAFSSDYMGTDFVLFRTATANGAEITIEQILRWWLFHEPPAAPTSERVVLWVPSNILP